MINRDFMVMPTRQEQWSRGKGWFLIIAIFLGGLGAALQLAPSVKQFEWLPWTFNNTLLKILVALLAFGLIMYTGFLLGSIKAIAFWNDAFIPVLFVLYSVLGGMGLLLATHGLVPEGAAYLQRLEALAPWLLSLVALILAVYIYIMYNKTPAARRAVLDIIKGKTLGAVCELAGGFSFRYSLVKAGSYEALI